MYDGLGHEWSTISIAFLKSTKAIAVPLVQVAVNKVKEDDQAVCIGGLQITELLSGDGVTYSLLYSVRYIIFTNETREENDGDWSQIIECEFIEF